MIFASTISHAEEITRYLPDGQWQLVTGSTKKKERERIINNFKRRRYKYLVNVAVLTTGFDAPHVDMIAIMRATESAGLLQQIIGRGLRLSDSKENCLVLDYAENIERHGLEENIFEPEITARPPALAGGEIEVKCPSCSCITFKKRRNDPIYDGLAHDEFGNFIISGMEEAIAFDEEGNPTKWVGPVMTMVITDPSVQDEFGDYGTKEIPIPAHYSRRCDNPEASVIRGNPIPCDHRFSYKVCPKCLSENDIAARHCKKCKERMVDPNDKLVETASRLKKGDSVWVDCSQAFFAKYIKDDGSESLKTMYMFSAGKGYENATAWHTKKQHWIFNKLCRINGTHQNSITDYAQCERWLKAPSKIKIQKIKEGGYTHHKVLEIRE